MNITDEEHLVQLIQETIEFISIHIMKLRPEKNSCVNGMQTHDICDSGAVLYQPTLYRNLQV